MKRLRVASSLLFLSGFLLLYYAYYLASPIYLTFAIFNMGLGYGVGIENKTAIKVALVYAGVTFFFSLLFLIAGNPMALVEVAISFFIIHDILSYIKVVVQEEEAEEGPETGTEE
ncbi:MULTISPECIES: hypothetical protein [Thermococcus]|jgi:hypothetical protein|uniref:Uncharacterized protein n=1 Tax=Thermococcus radiotolerans TaxID=187880 RepID=A0A2Z2MZJ3_9EURY|nr:MULTISPECIES: hypothetical protein [Thermococcus]ASA77824.1 hypothetical protein CDI07_05775 [Thermococcus sp. 5-4]ASJ13733.1 hypothetical protein A3L10_00785 [Thermococcus radiotolerans]